MSLTPLPPTVKSIVSVLALFDLPQLAAEFVSQGLLKQERGSVLPWARSGAAVTAEEWTDAGWSGLRRFDPPTQAAHPVPEILEWELVDPAQSVHLLLEMGDLFE
jgi:hypothetical protein